MYVHNNLGKGFSEIIYKDALEYEFNKHACFVPRNFTVFLP